VGNAIEAMKFRAAGKIFSAGFTTVSTEKSGTEE
jgi:hypothetical protein